MKMILVPIIGVAPLKVGAVFVRDGLVRVILKVEENSSPFSDGPDYYVSRGVDFDIFPKDKSGFIAEMQSHPELKHVQYLYQNNRIGSDFWFQSYNANRGMQSMAYAQRITFPKT